MLESLSAQQRRFVERPEARLPVVLHGRGRGAYDPHAEHTRGCCLSEHSG